ncbi:STAS domain-containing protein [Streptomyces sp. HSG2]|uniref:STAS domain-containing protein n=1 Tax=Streptomyces sp. HSG2 TaxID=2797167 RepID=UPI001F5BF99D|nr:STAS domain-containing protein [Streptomyces sp. HSG2]
MTQDMPAGAGTAWIAEAGGERAVLMLAGDLSGPSVLRELEELLLDPRLACSPSWVLDTARVDRLDLACAYAVLRAVTTTPRPVALVVRGADRGVHRTLRQAGLDRVAVFEA